MIFTARVPAGDSAFAYRAWLRDGRLRQPGMVRYAPRPVTQSVQASVVLPARLGKKADGGLFEEPQRGGDITYHLGDAQARLRVTAQVELHSARVFIKGANERSVVTYGGTVHDDGAIGRRTVAATLTNNARASQNTRAP